MIPKPVKEATARKVNSSLSHPSGILRVLMFFLNDNNFILKMCYSIAKENLSQTSWGPSL